MKRWKVLLLLCSVCLLAGCQENEQKNAVAPAVTDVPVSTPTICVTPTDTPVPTSTSTPTPTPIPISETDASAFQFVQKDDGTIKIIGLKDTSLQMVKVPKEIYGILVTEIGENAFRATKIENYGFGDVTYYIETVAKGEQHVHETPFDIKSFE